jgi:hypothetical protein
MTKLAWTFCPRTAARASTLRLAPALCALALAPIWMGADGCEDKTVGDKNQHVDKGCTDGPCIDADGGNSGGDCTYEGQSHATGDSFAASDGCNTCTCADDGKVGCTDKACAGDAGTSSGDCTFEGKSYSLGDSIPRADGCGTCTCGKAGEVQCPGLACPWLSPNWSEFSRDVGSAFGGSHNATVKPDGSLTNVDVQVDEMGMQKPAVTTQKTLSAEDLSALTQAINQPEFRNGAKNGFGCPPPPEDVGILVTLTVEGQQLNKDVTGCLNDSSDNSATPARDALAKITAILAKYL